MLTARTTLGIGVVAIGALLASCSSAPATAEGTGSPAPQGGTLVYAADLEPPCLDPHQSGNIGTAIITQNLAESLVYQGSDGEFQPWLAQSWEKSEDNTSFTFTLREGVTFHNGEAFDAAAVKANMDYWTDPETKSTAGSSLGYVESQIVDDHTITLVFDEAHDLILQGLSLSSGGMLAPASLTNKEALCAGTDFYGTGPFQLASYTKGQGLVLDRYADYVGGRGTTSHEGPAHLESVEIRFLPEAGARLGALSSDQAQIIANVPVTDASTVDANPELTLERAQALGASYALNLNTQRPPFDDENVRTALLRGLDIDSLVEGIYQGFYERAWSPVVPNTPPAGSYLDELEGEWPVDRAAAAALLDDAGWDTLDAEGYRTKDGQRLSATWLVNGGGIKEQRDVLGEAIVADAKGLGIEINRQILDVGAFTTQLREEDYDLSDISLQRAEADLMIAQFHSERTPAQSGYNYSLLSDPAVDELLESTVSGDAQERAAAFGQVQRILIDEAVVVPIYDPWYLAGVRETVTGFGFTTAGYPDWFYDVALAK